MIDPKISQLYIAYARFALLNELKKQEREKIFEIIREENISDTEQLDERCATYLQTVKVLESALLYVVIEGYRKFQFVDPAIDELLSVTEEVQMLKELRHTVFHVEEDGFKSESKMLRFFVSANRLTWIDELDKAFEKFFININSDLRVRRD